MSQQPTAQPAAPPDRAAFRAERRRLRDAIRAKHVILKGQAAFQKSEERRRFKTAVDRDKAKRACDAALSRADRNKQRAQQSVAAQLRTLESDQQKTEEQKLELLRQEHIGAALRKAHISVKELNGFGVGLVNDLAARGIRTAADFTGVSRGPAPNSKGGDVMWIHRSNSLRVHINGIGEHRAKALVEWRKSYVTRAEERAPKRLTLADRRKIEEATRRRRAELEEQDAAAQVTADEARDEAKKTLTMALARLDEKDHTAAREAAAQQAQYDLVAQELARLETELEALIAAHGSFRFRRPSRTSAERTYSSTRTPKTLPRQEPKAPPVTPVKVKTKTRVSRPATKRPSLLWLVPIMIYLSCALTGTPKLSELRPSTGLFLFLGHAIVVGYLSKQWLRRRREWRYLGSTSRMPVLGLNLIWIWAVALVALKAQYG